MLRLTWTENALEDLDCVVTKHRRLRTRLVNVLASTLREAELRLS